jgi:hypothetical protein
VSPKDVAELLDIDNDTAGKYLRRLVDDGRIQKLAFGHFTRITSEDKQVSESSESEGGQQSSSSEPVSASDTSPENGHSDNSDTRTRVQQDSPKLTLVTTCPSCDEPLGATGKCVPCIVRKASA